jgi:hypothetical protein
MYFEIVYCVVIYSVVLLLGVVFLMAGSTTSVPVTPGYGGYFTIAAKEYTGPRSHLATQQRHHTQHLTTRFQSITPQLMMPLATPPKSRSTTLRLKVLHH